MSVSSGFPRLGDSACLPHNIDHIQLEVLKNINPKHNAGSTVRTEGFNITLAKLLVFMKKRALSLSLNFHLIAKLR
jgi:hypothetical protein